MNNALSKPQGVKLEVHGPRKSYAGEEILKGLDFEVQPGEVPAIMGPRGGGKSVLLKQLSGWEALEAGTILIGGDPVQSPERRVEAPATPEQKKLLAKLSPEQFKTTELAGEKIEVVLNTAPGNGELIGGLKAVTKSGWFAARPSGTEDIYKIYAESFQGADHLRRILAEAQTTADDALAASSSRGIPLN